MVEVQKKLKDPFFLIRLFFLRQPLDHRECTVPCRVVVSFCVCVACVA
jgi:hypothetical protein